MTPIRCMPTRSSSRPADCRCPSTGSDGAGLRIVELSGHDGAANVCRADAPHRAPGALWLALRRVAAGDVTARAEGLSSTATGGFLFTHHGYSGPAILDVSHVAVRSRAEQASPGAA